jgi:hypothetical protein
MRKNSIAALLGNKESRDKIFANAKAGCRGGGLLDLIQSHKSDGDLLDSDKGWTRIARKPEIEEIDHYKSSSALILKGRAVLKDGRRVYWK